MTAIFDHSNRYSRFANGHLKAPVTRRVVLGGLGAAAGLAALGLGGRRASATTTVTFLGWQGYDDPYKAGDFLAQHDAALETTYINTTEDIITKLRSGGVGTIDLATLNHMYVEVGALAGLLDPIDPTKIGNYDKMLPTFKSVEGMEFDGKLYGVPFTFSSCTLLYNPAMVSEPPTAWADFLKPEYKGKVALFSDAMTNVIVWSRVATGTETPTRMTPAELDETIDLLIKLKKEHARAMPASMGDGADLLARGEVAMIMGWEPMVAWCADKGLKVEMGKPKEGTWGFLDVMNIGKDAPNYELDHVFIDQCIAADVQAQFANTNLLGIVNADAVPQLSETVRALYNFDDLDAYFGNARLYPMFPLESDGTHVTFDEMLEGYERFMKA
jgi:spermidine/putrescine transport system substrate-binding protein